MKPIEERATVAFPRIGDPADVLSRHGYIAGAIEQREIDIQRAVEWLSSHLSFSEIDIDIFITSFKQAMKGE